MVAHYRGAVPSPLENDSNVRATFAVCYVDVDGEGNCDLADLNVAGEPIGRTVLTTRTTASKKLLSISTEQRHGMTKAVFGM